MAGTIIAASPLITRLEGQSLGYVGATLSNFDSSLEPQIIGNFEIAGSIGSFASLESITGWAALSNGAAYIKIVPDTTAGTVAAEFTATAPTWDNAKMGWYGTGAAANHRYLFKLTKGGASLWSDKRPMPKTASENVTVENDLKVSGDIAAVGGAFSGAVSGTTGTFSGALSGTTINTGAGAVECYAMDQNVRTTDAVTFATVNTGAGANELYAMNQNVRTTDAVTFATVNTGAGAVECYAMNQNVRSIDSPAFAGTTLNGAFIPSGSPVASTITAVSEATVVIPRGIYNVSIDEPTSGSGQITIYTSGGIPIMRRSYPAAIGDQIGGVIIADGTNVKLYNHTGATVIVRLYKF